MDILKKVYKVIKFNQKGCFKPYIKMNTEHQNIMVIFIA